jgi:hypothetical protein
MSQLLHSPAGYAEIPSARAQQKENEINGRIQFNGLCGNQMFIA